MTVNSSEMKCGKWISEFSDDKMPKIGSNSLCAKVSKAHFITVLWNLVVNTNKGVNQSVVTNLDAFSSDNQLSNTVYVQ